MIYFGGDSWTYGDELSDRSNSFPNLIGNNFNLNIINDAVSGGSNTRIVRKFFQNISKDIKLVIISWTLLERFEGFYKENAMYPGWSNLSYWKLKIWQEKSTDKSVKKTIKGLQSYLHYVRTPEYVAAEFLTHILKIQKTCLLCKIPVIMTNVFPIFDNSYLTNYKPITNLNEYQKINWNDVWLKNKDFNFYNFSKENKFKFGPREHVLEDGHRAIADLFIEKINRENLLK
jgi:hypothetical protein